MALALGCPGPEPVFLEGQPDPAAEEIARSEFAFIKNSVLRSESEGPIVYGRFEKMGQKTLLPESEAEALRDLYANGYDAEEPFAINHKFAGAYRFVGHKFEAGALLPFEAKDLTITLSLYVETKW